MENEEMESNKHRIPEEPQHLVEARRSLRVEV